MSRMSTAGRIGQLLSVAFTGSSADSDLDDALARLHPGAVLFYGRNIGTLAEVQALTDVSRQEVAPRAECVVPVAKTFDGEMDADAIPGGDDPIGHSDTPAS